MQTQDLNFLLKFCKLQNVVKIWKKHKYKNGTQLWYGVDNILILYGCFILTVKNID
jgi:hypothetical protein